MTRVNRYGSRSSLSKNSRFHGIRKDSCSIRAISSKSPVSAGRIAYSAGSGLRSATLLLGGARPRVDSLERRDRVSRRAGYGESEGAGGRAVGRMPVGKEKVDRKRNARDVTGAFPRLSERQPRERTLRASAPAV